MIKLLSLSKLLFISFVIFLISGITCDTSYAQSSKISKKVTSESKNTTARILNFKEGQTLTTSSRFFNNNTKTIKVVGRFEKVPSSIKDSDLKVVVSGRDIVSIAGSSLTVSRSKTPSKLMRVGFSVSLPAPLPGDWPMLDVVTELVYKPSNQVLAREVVSLYDLRNNNASASADPTARGINISAQLSNPGIGKGQTNSIEGLEIPLISNAPYPSLNDFNIRLANTAANTPGRKLENLVEDYDSCIPLEDLDESRFRNPLAFSAYAVALAEANTLYAAYLAVQNGSAACGLAAPLCQLIANGFACVQEQPTASDFELCVDKIVGKPKSLSVQSMSDLSMKFVDSNLQNAGIIEANVDFTAYNSLIDSQLQNLSVRWINGNCSSLLRPGAMLNNEELTQVSWLNQWSVCRDQQLDSALATTKLQPNYAPQYAVQKDPTSNNRLYVSDYRLANFDLLNQTLVANKGSCNIDQFVDPANDHLALFSEQLAGVLSDTWNLAAPQSSMSQQLDLLFRPYAIGETSLPFHTISSKIESVKSSSSAGLLIDWSTLVSPTEDAAFRRLKNSIFANVQGPDIQSANGTDGGGVSFDSSYGVTLNFINKVLWARSAGSELNQKLTFTTGGGPSTGGGIGGIGGSIGGLPSGSSTSVTGSYLATLHKGFKELKGKNYEFVLSRVIDPFVYMPEDPSSGIPGVGFPVRYGVRSLKIILKEVDTVKGSKVTKKGKTVIEFDASFYDEDFSLSIDSTVGSQLLNPLASPNSWIINVKDSNLANCPMFSHQRGVNQRSACERGLENAINLLIRDKLTGIFAELVSDIPAPQHFNTEGQALTTVQLNDQSKLQFDGRITLFGQYTPN